MPYRGNHDCLRRRGQHVLWLRRPSRRRRTFVPGQLVVDRVVAALVPDENMQFACQPIRVVEGSCEQGCLGPIVVLPEQGGSACPAKAAPRFGGCPEPGDVVAAFDGKGSVRNARGRVEMAALPAALRTVAIDDAAQATGGREADRAAEAPAGVNWDHLRS